MKKIRVVIIKNKLINKKELKISKNENIIKIIKNKKNKKIKKNKNLFHDL